MGAATTAKALAGHRGSFDPWGRNREAIEEHRALAAKLNEEARANWDKEEWHRQVAADLAETLDYGFTYENLFGTYVQFETVGEFDRVTLRERRGLRVFFTSRGGYIEESQLRTERWELPRDTAGFHVSEHIDKLRANFAETIEDLIDLGEQRFEAEVNRRLLTMMQAAIPPASAYYESVGALDPATLNSAIIEVADAVQPNGRGPVPITIIGRARAVGQISDFSGFADEAKEEIRLRGRLGTYRGANVVQLNNYTDEDGVSYVDDNELWVMGGTVGKFVAYGGMQTKSWEENTVDYRHYRARKDIGGLVHHPEQARRIVITG